MINKENDLNREIIEIILSGDNNIGLATISSFLPILDTVLSEVKIEEDRIETFVLPFEKGSFKLILDIFNNPIIIGAISGVLSQYLVSKLKFGGKKGNFKVVKQKDNSGLYTIIYDDGTIDLDIPREIIKLSKDPRLNKQFKVFVKNYYKEGRGDLVIRNKTKNKTNIFTKKDLKQMSVDKKFDTTSKNTYIQRLWVEVESWGYQSGTWILKPLDEINLTKSTAKIKARLTGVSFLSPYILEENTHLANRYLEIELLVEFKFDEFEDKITGNPKYYINNIFTGNKPKLDPFI